METLQKCLDAAFKSGGEYAWRPEQVDEVIDVLGREALAILGGEYWLIDQAEIHGLIPQEVGPPAVFGWNSPEQGDNEDWSTWVKVCVQHAHDAVAAYKADPGLDTTEGKDLYVNLTWVTEPEYRDIRRTISELRGSA